MIKRFTGIFFIFLLLLSSFAFVQPISATNIETIYYDTSSFVDYFKIWGLVGTVSADGYVYGATCIPTLTHDSAKQYWVFYLYLAPQDGEAIAEIPIPTSYGGISVEYFNGSAWLTADGISKYKLSVPYRFNNTDKFTGISYSEGSIPADWAGADAPTVVNGLGEGGSLYRVQLAISTPAAVQLRITLRYVTSPVMLVEDGVDDYILVADADSLTPAAVNITYQVKIIRYATSISGGIFCKGNPNGNRAFEEIFATDVATDFKNTTGSLSTPSTLRFALGTVYAVNVIANNTNAYYVVDGVAGTAKEQLGAINNDGRNLLIGNSEWYPTVHPSFILYSFGIYNYGGSSVLLLNASSYNPTSGLFEDFSGRNNDGTPYGNVQYKAFTGNSFAWTLAGITPALNADDVIMNIYGEMGMFTALCMIIIFFVITLVAYIKLQNKTIVLLSVVFGLMINILSLSSGIPFVPFPQIFFSIVELLVLIYAHRMNM